MSQSGTTHKVDQVAASQLKVYPYSEDCVPVETTRVGKNTGKAAER